ncbi:MAG: hypothetical protein KY461_05695 [Actinobacteria bacterium]|nr:hypothetical protein [Actinomycetota bacterium]
MPSDPAASFDPAPDVARWLVGDAGLDVLADVVRELDGGTAELAVATRLRRDGLAPDRARIALDAAVARRRARARFPDADALVLTTSALEQSSHPAASAARAARYADAASTTDLCSGIGGDALAIAARGPTVVAVDRDAARMTLLEHNARVRGLDVTAVVADVLAYPVPAGSPVHADPGRRAAGRRLRRLSELHPPVPSLLAHVAPAPGVGVALSPAVDLADPALPAAAELEFLQLGPQLLEASLWLGGLRHGSAVATATLLAADGAVRERRTRTAPPAELPVGEVGSVLLEPRAAAVRARLHDTLGEELGARRLARHRALLTADAHVPSPWFDAWQVEAVLPLRAKDIAAWLRSADVGPVELATHGLDADPVAWWRRIGRPPRGPAGTRVHLVRLDDGAVCLIGRPLD